MTETHKGYLESLGSYLAQADCAQVEHKESKIGKATRQYLWLISKAIGWPWVRFIWYALGKYKVEHLNQGQYIKLVKYIAQHRELFVCRRLEDRVVQYQFQERYMNPYINIVACSKISQIPKPIIHYHKALKSGRDKKAQVALRIVKALPSLHMNLISTSWNQAPSKTLRGPALQVRSREHDWNHNSSLNLASDSYSAIGASEKRKRKGGEETATDGTVPVPASRRNDIVFHSITESSRSSTVYGLKFWLTLKPSHSS